MESIKYWFMNVDGKNQGPYKEEDLIIAYRAKKINDMTPVWTDGLSDWIAFTKSELADKVKVTPPKFEPEKFSAVDEKKFSLDLLNETGEDNSQRIQQEAQAINLTSDANANNQTLEEPIHYVGFWYRYLAYFIDSVILFFVRHLVNLAMPVASGVEFPTSYTWWVWTSLLGFLYFGVLQAIMQGTLAKKALGIVVVNEKLLPMDMGTGILRYVCFLLFNIPLFIGAIWAAFDSRKQGLHDKVAKTFVVRIQDIKKSE